MYLSKLFSYHYSSLCQVPLMVGAAKIIVTDTETLDYTNYSDMRHFFTYTTLSTREKPL